MKISDITRFLENLAPLAFQEDYDNSGLLLGTADEDCKGALVCLDTTEAVVREAVDNGCNLIISHHPLIFHGLRQINTGTGTGRTLTAAIRNNLAVYAIHTNLDNVSPGVNTTIAGRLGLVNRHFLLPKTDSGTDQRSAGSGLAGELAEPLSEKQFLQLLQQQFRIPVIRHSALTGKTVRKIALCGGSGSSLITNALSFGADFFITSDIKYHAFFEAEGRLVIADIGHYESEQFTIDFLYDAILEKFPNFAVLKAGIATNPVHYYF